MDMRAFGQTQTAAPGLIDDPNTNINDAMTFLTAYKQRYLSSAEDSNTPIVLYGYSLGGTMCLGTYFNLLEQ